LAGSPARRPHYEAAKETAMTLDPMILRSSFELVIDRRPDLTMRFYEILFERYPGLKRLFSRDRTAQSKMLAGALAAVLDHLEDAPWLQETLGGLGAKHVSYGVTDEMYAMVGDALLATLAEVAAEAWTPEVQAQWTEAFGAIASMMQAGAQQVVLGAASARDRSDSAIAIARSGSAGPRSTPEGSAQSINK
jgi:hemoglobin-like flavoprotein